MSDDVYLRKDVFDAELHRVEETTGGAIQDLRDRIDDLKARIDDMRHAQTLSFARWGLFVAVCVCVIQVALTIYLSK